MTTIQAIVVKEPGVADVSEVPIPTLRPDYILVKVHAIALNPTDWKHIDKAAEAGCRIGCDYSGTVLEVGSAVTKPLRKGDRVCGAVHGGNRVHHEDGSFGDVITAKGDVQIKIPDNLSFEEAATLGVGISTVGQGLYQSLKLPLPSKPADEAFPVLIYGGSTATGALAIQFAKLSGLHVITTCSPHNADYVKSLGADKVFSYKDADCAKQIREYTGDKLSHVFDCISEGNSIEISVESISSAGGVYSALLAVDSDKVKSLNANVQSRGTLAYTIFGELFTMPGKEFPPITEDFEFAKGFWEEARQLLAEGKVKVHKVALNETGKGLQGALKGLELMRQGKLSGKKLVYNL